MDDDQLETTLGLTRRRVESTVDFLVTYANTCEQERDEYRAPDEEDTEPTRELGLTGERWNLHLEAASARCEAGEWAMLIDPLAALNLWREAGRLYRVANFGFGYYLSAITRDLDGESAERLGLAVAVFAARARPPTDAGFQITVTVPLREEAQHPQQQAYWLLAAITFAAQSRRGDLVEPILNWLQYSPNRYSGAPIGALGIPTATLWEAAGWLVQPSDTGMRRFADLLGDLARRYSASVRPAMQNRYLWENGAAVLDVGNVDIASLTMSGSVVFGNALEERMRAQRDNMDDVARAQLEVSLDLTHEELWPA